MARNDEDPFHPANAAALVVDGTATVLGCTPAAEALLNRPAAELRGRAASSLLADPGRWPEVMAQRDGTVWEGAATLRSDGENVDVTFCVLPLSGGGGSEDRWLVFGATRALMARWREDYAFIEELFLQRRVGLAVFDRELRIVRTNAPLLPYTGVPPDPTGMRLADFLWEEDARQLEELLRPVLLTGTPLVGAEAEVHTSVDPRGGRVVAMSAFRLLSSAGQAMGVTALYLDVTEERRARSRLDLLHRATAVLGSSLEMAGTAQDLADVLVPDLADVAAVDVADAVYGHRDPDPEHHGRHLLRRAASTGAEGGGAHLESLVEVDTGGSVRGHLWQREPPDGSARGAGAAPGDAEAAAGAGVEGARYGMTAPLCARGLLLGRVSVWRTGEMPFDEKDLELLEDIASRAALVMDNARRYGLEHRAAVSLQSSLLPPAVTDTVAVQSASVYLPTEVSTGVSGDWFDVIPLSSARVALVVGDVVGHGLQAIATMGRLRTAVRTLADLDMEPDELLTHLDDLVSQLTVEADSGSAGASGSESSGAAGGAAGREAGRPGPYPSEPYRSFGATCLYLTYDPVTRGCMAASAGHPPPAVLSPGGRADYLDISPGPPLGVGGLPFELLETVAEEGSVLALFTNGLVEHGGDDVDGGMAALLGGLREAEPFLRPLQEVARDVVAGLAPTRLPDDITLLLARTRTVPPDSTAVWTLEADPEVVASARKAVAAQLSSWDLDDLTFTTELVTSELVTNAIRHAGGPIELRLIRATTLICEVSDPSSTQPRMRRAAGTEEGGRGLYLVAQLSSRWGSRYTRDGKTIWAEQQLPGPSRDG